MATIQTECAWALLLTLKRHHAVEKAWNFPNCKHNSSPYRQPHSSLKQSLALWPPCTLAAWQVLQQCHTWHAAAASGTGSGWI